MKWFTVRSTRTFSQTILLTMFLAIYGCGDINDGGNQNAVSDLGDIAAYSPQMLRDLSANGNSEKAVKILQARIAERSATTADYLLLAEIHIDRLEPAEAANALERAEMMGATKQVLALHSAEVSMLQGRFSAARDELQLIPMSGLTGFKVAMLRGRIEAAEDNVEAARRFFSAARRLNLRTIDAELELAMLEFDAGNLDTAFELAQSTATKPMASNDPRPDYIMGAVSRLRRDSRKATAYLESGLAKSPNNVLLQLELLGASLDIGDREKAQQILDTVLAAVPSNPIAQFYVAYIQWQDGETRAAKELILKTNNLLNNYRPAKKLYANAAFDEGDYEGAARYFREYLTQVPDDLEVRLKLADSLRRLGRADDALRIVTPALPGNQAYSNDADDAPTRTAENMQVTTEESTKVQTPDNQVTIMVLTQAGAAELAQNNLERARQKYTEAFALASSLDPAEPDIARPIAVALATMAFNSENQNTGIQLMKKAIKLGNPTPQQLTTLANMQMLAGKLNDAASTLNQLAALEDPGPIKDNLAGTLAMRNKNYDSAIAAFSKAIETNPNYVSAIKNRAAAYIENAMFEEALADLKSMTPYAEGDGQYYAMLGKTHQRLGQYVGAINAYETALELIPNSSFLHANYALMLGEKERYAEALAAAKQALKLMPENTNASSRVKSLVKEWETIIERNETLGRK